MLTAVFLGLAATVFLWFDAPFSLDVAGEVTDVGRCRRVLRFEPDGFAG